MLCKSVQVQVINKLDMGKDRLSNVNRLLNSQVRCNTVQRGGFNGPYLLAFSELVKSLAVHGTSQTLLFVHLVVTS